MMGQKRVLVVGSGYVAQHLVASLSKTGEFAVCYTHRRAAAPFAAPPGVGSCALDLLAPSPARRRSGPSGPTSS